MGSGAGHGQGYTYVEVQETKIFLGVGALYQEKIAIVKYCMIVAPQSVSKKFNEIFQKSHIFRLEKSGYKPSWGVEKCCTVLERV